MCEQHLAQGSIRLLHKGLHCSDRAVSLGAAGAEPGGQPAGKIASCVLPERVLPAAEPWCLPHRLSPFPAVESTLLQHAGHFPCQGSPVDGGGEGEGMAVSKKE